MWQAVDIETWMARRTSRLGAVKETVEGIIGQVRDGGDKALIGLAEKFDKVHLDSVAVDEEAREAAYEKVDPKVTESLVEAEARISRFHEAPAAAWALAQVRRNPVSRSGSRPPRSRGSVHTIPGGRAAYPSTALMCTVPARIAGSSGDLLLFAAAHPAAHACRPRYRGGGRDLPVRRGTGNYRNGSRD